MASARWLFESLIRVVICTNIFCVREIVEIHLLIEELIFELKKDYTVVIVTHNMQQAARISDYTCFMYLGELIEYGETTQIFESPRQELTEKYITGRFG